MHGDGVRVLVVGAGIAGLAAARTLRGWGATVEVVERAAEATTAGSGIYLPADAVRALGGLGLAATVAEQAVSIERQEFADHRGNLLFDVEIADLWRGVGPCLAMHRSDLHRVMLSGITGLPVRWGLSPRSLTSHPEGATVELSDGSTGRYDLVVGADGLHSTVRRLVFGVAAGSIGLYGRRFLVTRPGMPPVWSLMLGPHASFLTLPIGRDRLYCYADCRDGDPPPPLRELLAGFAEPAIPVLDAFDDAGGVISHGGWVEEVTLDSWARGDVLLIGDAAHATSPNMAQGAAMAFEDALVLAQALTAAAGIRDGLQIYERRRRPRTDWVLQQTRRRDRTRALPDTVRNVVLRRLGRRIHYGNFRPLLRPA